MKIAVLIKPVKSELIFPNEKRNEAYLFNPYDLNAFLNCLEIKRKQDCQVICMSMGPLESETLLVKALALGADDAVLLNDNAFIGSDTVATTYILGKAFEKLDNIDLVVCGEKSVDGETGQVVAGISERLGWICVTGIQCIREISEQQAIINIKEGEVTADARIHLPAVISFRDFNLKQPGISLLALKRAKHRGITLWKASDIDADIRKCGLNGSKTKVLNVENQLVKKEKIVVEGAVTEKVNLIFNMIHKKNGSLFPAD